MMRRNRLFDNVYFKACLTLQGISSYGININDPRLNVNTKERNALKKFWLVLLGRKFNIYSGENYRFAFPIH